VAMANIKGGPCQGEEERSRVHETGKEVEKKEWTEELNLLAGGCGKPRVLGPSKSKKMEKKLMNRSSRAISGPREHGGEVRVGRGAATTKKLKLSDLIGEVVSWGK